MTRSLYLGIAALMMMVSSSRADDARNLKLAQANTSLAPQPSSVDQDKSPLRQAMAASAAQTQMMTPLFGNTLIYTNDVPADTLRKVYNADHTWVSWYPLGRANRGTSYKAPHHRGTWEFRGADTLCDTYHRSSIRPHVTVCQKIAVHHIGDTWNDSTGLSVTLLQGVQ
jgi:hypothetical protein